MWLLVFLSLRLSGASRFAIVSVVTEPVPPYYAQGITNRALYATRHGYAFRLYNKIDIERPTSWSKVLALKSTMKSGHFDWLLWLDSDALITNFETSLDEFLPKGPDIDMVVSRDCMNFNMGVFLLRCSQSGLHLLEDIYSGSHVTNDTIADSWWEQRSFIQLYETSESLPSRVLAVPQKSFNSYHDSDCGGQWTEGDFIVHFPGRGAADKEVYIERYLHKVLQHG